MQRISPTKPSLPTQLSTKLFLAPCTNNIPFQLILLLLQCTVYLYLISGFVPGEGQGFVGREDGWMEEVGWIGVLGVCVGVRLGLGVSVVRGGYVLCIGWLLDNATTINTASLVVISLLLFLTLLIDILSHTELQFNTPNPYSQTHNITKLLHYLILPLTLTLYSKLTTIPAFIVSLCNLVLFGVLLLAKLKSRASHLFFREILLRFYVVGLGYFLRNFGRFWGEWGVFKGGYQHLVVVVGTQLVYTAISYKYSKLQVQIQISNGNIITIIYSILSYLHSNSYNPQSQQVLQQFLSLSSPVHYNSYNQQHPLSQHISPNQQPIRRSIFDPEGSKGNDHDMRDDKRVDVRDLGDRCVEEEEVEGTDKGFGSSMGLGVRVDRINTMRQPKMGIIDSLTTPTPQTLHLSQKCLQLLQSSITSNTDNPTKCTLLICQIKHTIFHNLLTTRYILQKLKEQLSWYDVIDRICVYKLEVCLRRNVENRYAVYGGRDGGYREFFGNQTLRGMVVRNSYQYLELWKYIHNNDIQFSKLSTLMSKLLQNSTKIDTLYSTLPQKCTTLITLYIDYLYMVRRDVPTAKHINRSCTIYEQSSYMLNVDNKIYICVGMEDRNRMVIENVGFNVRRLLGYERGEVRFRRIQMFMPGFLAEIHEKMLVRAMDSNQFNLYIFNKNIIIKNNDNYYQPATLSLKLIYDLHGTLKMQGYFQIQTNKYKQNIQTNENYFNWTNYFFISKRDEQLMEVSPSLRDIIDLKPRKFVHCGDYFQNLRMSGGEGDYQNSISNASSNFIGNGNVGGVGNGGVGGSSGGIGVGNNVHGSVRSCNSIVNNRKYLYTNGTQYQYILYRTLQLTPQNEFLYYVCKSQQDQIAPAKQQLSSSTKQNLLQKFQDYLNSSLKYQKYPMKYEDFDSNLEEYFKKKEDLLGVIRRDKPFWMFGLVLGLCFGVFVMMGVLIGRVEVAKASNDVIKNDMVNLIEFFHDVSNIGMVLKKGSFRVRMNVTYPYQYYPLQQLCLNLQGINQQLQKFDKKTYSLPQSSPSYNPTRLQYPKPLKQLISQLLSNILFTNFLRDMTLITIAYRNIGYIFDLIWGAGLDDYLAVYFQSVNRTVNQDNRIKLGISVCVIGILVVVWVVVVKIDDVKREYQYLCIDAVSNLNTSIIFCNSTNQFLRRSVGGLSDKDLLQHSPKSPKSSPKPPTTTLNSPNTSNILQSSRQNSVRGLFEQSMLNSTNRSHHNSNNFQPTISNPFNTIQIKEKKELDESERRREKMRSRSKVFLGIWAVVFAVVVGVIVGYLITDSTGNQVSLTDSVKNLLIILRKSTKFSSTIISFLDMISMGKPDTLFLSNYNSYQQLQKSNSQVIFEEASYVEFSNFSSFLQKVNYVYLCQYMECEEQYRSEVNIMYNSAVHRFNSYMITNTNLTNTTLSPQSTSTLQLLFYSHYLLQNTLYTLLKTYISDYNRYETNKYARTYTFYECQVVAFLVFVATCFGYYCWHFRREREVYVGYLGIVRRESYEGGEEL